MTKNDSSMILVVSMMMGLSGFMASSSIALLVGVYLYRHYFKDGGIVGDTMTAAWTDTEIKLPEKAKDDKDHNCVYFYDHGKKWTDGGGKDGTIKASGRWCISDGVDKHIPIGYAKNQQGILRMNTVDYIRLGKNLNVTVWDNADNNRIGEDNFKGKGNQYTFRGENYGLSKLIRVDKDSDGAIKRDDIDAFSISKV